MRGRLAAWLTRPTPPPLVVAVAAAALVVAVRANSTAQLARARAAEAAEWRLEAELQAGLTRLMTRADDLPTVLAEAGRHLACRLRLPFAVIELDTVPGGRRRVALPLHYGERTGTLLVPAGLPEPVLRRLRERVVPSVQTFLLAATDRENTRNSLRATRDELHQLADEQAIVRRLAVLVARGAPAADVVAAVSAETSALLEADATQLLRYEAPGTVTVVGEYSKPDVESVLGQRIPLTGGVTEMVLRTSRPSRVDNYAGRKGDLPELARRVGFNTSVAVPVLVEGRVWGALVVLWRRQTPPPPGIEARLAQFTELVATAVANTESRAELTASRARIVLAGDEARRRIERDLHDGVQQRLVSLGLELRAAEELVPDDLDEIKVRLAHTVEGLTHTFKDLQELSRGIHPAIVSQGGLMPALRSLAHRCPIPVTINAGLRCRLSASVEVAAYYVVSEALTNAAKYSHASAVEITVDGTRDDAGTEMLVLSITDDGIGGADPTRGSGLTGIIDRVEALGGHMRLVSPAGGGTSLSVTLPTLGASSGAASTPTTT